jgi:transposase
VPFDHPLRPIRKIVDQALDALTWEFEKLYAKLGQPSIPPEKLLRALLLQAFYSVRSELAVDGAARLQSVVPVVCRAVAGRRSVGRDGLHKEP